MIRRSALFYYATSILLIAVWWMLAFKNPSSHSLPVFAQIEQFPQISLHTSLSPIRRNLLLEALSGDIALMAQLIADWDLDAQILENEGQKNVKRLERNAYLQSQLLSRQLLTYSPERLRSIREKERQNELQDDFGYTFQSCQDPQRLFPQTYAAASFLLALAEPERIVALPNGLRELTQLFPQKITQQIPDLDRFNAEKLYLSPPDIAFVADYSHPSFVETMQNQQIPLFKIKNLDSITEIIQSIKRVGHLIDCSLKANLLAIFVEAAFMAIDNHLLALQEQWKQQSIPKVLVVSHHSHFYLPSSHSLTGQLLKRLGICALQSSEEAQLRNAIDQEKIVQFNPDCMIVSTANRQATEIQMSHDFSLTELTAVKQSKLFFVDEPTQQFPSQFIVLAYFDLLHAIASANTV